MSNSVSSGNYLTGKKDYEPFPMRKLKRVDIPTTLVTDNIQRIDSRENAFTKARRGDYGPVVAKESPHAATKDPLGISLADIRRYVARTEKNQVSPETAPVPENPEILTRFIKRLGYFLKADIMSVSHVPEYAVYSHDMQGNEINIDYKYAVVIVMAKEYQTLAASNGFDWIGLPLSYDLYLRLAVISEAMANYIRRLGYPASAEYTGKMPEGCRVLFAPLLLWSGIGEVSRAGIILNPYLGMHFKAAVVLTDMPLVPDKPVDFGLQDFCQKCLICADYCPGNAIPHGEKTMHNGYETWKLNEQRCHSFRVMNKQGTYCGRCIKVCPWTKPNTFSRNIVRWAVQRSGIARRIDIQFSKLFKPDKARSEEKWWFDLEDVDGKLRIPPGLE
jgi:reductive dehalogenase